MASSPTRTKGLQRTNPSRLKRADSGNASYSPEEFANRELPLIYKPKLIKKIDINVFVFHCVTKGNSGCKFNKNMIVLVHNDGNGNVYNANDDEVQEEEEEKKGATQEHKGGSYLTVVNPLRLNEEGEARLMELGSEIRNVVRLGPSEHAAFEDEYYLTHRIGQCPSSDMKIQRWAPGKYSTCAHLPLDQILYDTSGTKQLSVDDPIAPESPHPDVQVFLFEETVQPEAILYLFQKKTLITGDCLQAQRDNPFVNELGKKHLQDNGLLVEDNDNGNNDNNNNSMVVISPRWLKLQCVVSNHSRKVKHSFRSNQAQRNKAFFTSSGKFKLRNDFQRMLQLDIKRFVSSSGNTVQQQAAAIKESIQAAAAKACQLV